MSSVSTIPLQLRTEEWSVLEVSESDMRPSAQNWLTLTIVSSMEINKAWIYFYTICANIMFTKPFFIVG